MKFGGEMALAGPLGRMLSGAPILFESPGGSAWDIVCAVPLHPTRRWVRGFDQAHLLAHWAMDHARRTLGPPLPRFEKRLLRRRRATAAQSDLGAAERLSNIRGAFRAAKPRAIVGASVLVIDDVTTTGATLHACFEVLRAAGAREWAGLTLARALIDAQPFEPALSA
jgi:ComF family protein